ncbi:4Fe-4S ferredoxin [bacterium BRH_c32]|nr:MAG: 4Fe-4S ferredoxin [bacterium BRH_c32]
MRKGNGILFDVTLCVGCGSCYEACKEANNLPETNKDFLKDHLSDNTFTVVEQYGDLFTRKNCMHCDDPACASVCLVGAIKKSETGAVIYDAEKCIGCRYCMQACPYKMPRYEWGKALPSIRKCSLCDTRVKEGKLPACYEACPTEATLYGNLEELIVIAKKRMKENPDQYFDKIYGLEEAGGTHVLVLSPVPFEQLGFVPNVPKEAMPEFTMRAMEKIPSVVSIGGVFLGGMYWLTKRKNELAKEKNTNNGN